MSRIADRQRLDAVTRVGLAENDLDGIESDLIAAEGRLHAEVERGNRALTGNFQEVRDEVRTVKRLMWSLVGSLVVVLGTLVATLVGR